MITSSIHRRRLNNQADVEFYLTATTFLDISSKIPVGNNRQLSITPDGSKISCLYYSNDKIYTYEMSTSNLLSTASYLGTTNSGVVQGWASKWANDGLNIANVHLNGTLYRRSCVTPFSASGSTLTAHNLGLGVGGQYPVTINFLDDGTRFWMCNYNTSTGGVFEFSLSTPWDFTTAGLVTRHLNLPLGIGSFVFIDNGNCVLWHDHGSPFVNLRRLSSAYDISTAETSDSGSYDTGITMFNIAKSDSDLKLYGVSQSVIHEFNITLNNL